MSQKPIEIEEKENGNILIHRGQHTLYVGSKETAIELYQFLTTILSPGKRLPRSQDDRRPA